MREEKEKTKKGRKTATIDWSRCRLASLGRLTLLLRLFGSEREKMRTPIIVSTILAYTFFYVCVCAYAQAQARIPTDEVSATGVVATSNAIK
jgi:hypothetical protein